ncbi:unnamed protein product [Rangifer tarandus platyrhynchus]|uniref:Uncharacterized protein n=1 Tax=Rangifer tarandus platyrhynchus TaxID=3082113 RepID=A0ABN8XQY1_RANTA|nr:unnamed protein product [Rangifer tarandus platyrhynchus]
MAPPPLLWGPCPGNLRTSVGSPDFHLPSSVSSPTSYFNCLTPLPTPGFPFQMSPATPEPGFSRCFPVPAEATGTLGRLMKCIGLEGWLQVHLPLASRIPAWTPGTDQP